MRLADFDTAGTGDDTDDSELPALVERIADLQALYAEEQKALLVVLQGIDAAGKDSSVSHVFRGTNPQGVRVLSFKEPSNEELAHDFLWRYHQHTPGYGMIHVFNRSHYDSINDFERMLAREGTTILKCFLHISKDAQLERMDPRWPPPDEEAEKFAAQLSSERVS
jgi:polyphosphate kinase 2 (PPK2 family)